MRLLSIGAGVEQSYFIKKAIELGHYVIAIDGNKDSVGFKYANESINMDIKNKSELIKVVKNLNIEGVLQVPIGNALTSIGAINDELKLIGISEEAARNCVNKEITNRILSENGIKCAKQILVKDLETLESDELNFPIVIKPNNGSGSNGVKILNNCNEIKEYLETNKELETIFIIEEFIDGIEYGADFVINKGTGKLVMLREKDMTESPYKQEVAIYTVSDNESELYREAEKVILNCCHALGIKDTLVHVDFKVNNGEIYIIELSGRPSGLMISSKLIKYAVNIDYSLLGLDIISKKDITFNLEYDKDSYGLCFFYLEPGIIEKIDSEMFKNKNILEYEMNIKEGDYVREVKSGRDLINRGYFIIKSNSIESLREIKSSILSKIIVKGD